MATVLFFHAHPDDEAIATGGTMAALSDRGERVVLVTATDGELGEIPDGLLDPGETLVERRRRELDDAVAVLGVARQVTLPFLDSGMEGEPTNTRPGAFAAAEVDVAARLLAGILEEEAADVLVVYDEHGGYGHPDHVQVHRVGMRAAELAGTPVVYMATMDRDFFAGLAELVADTGLELPEGEMDGVDEMGEPASRITTEIDVTPWIGRKRDAMRAHPSQIAEDSVFLALTGEHFSAVWGKEWYIRVSPPPPGEGTGAFEDGLALSAAASATAEPGAPAAGTGH